MNPVETPRQRRTADLSGMKFGRFTVMRFYGSKRRARTWLCVCICGKEKIVSTENLFSGNSASCGCARVKIKHGRSRTGDLTYGSWCAMKNRCAGYLYSSLKRYTAQGVTCCKRWKSFASFLEDMGERPPKKFTLDRINPFGNYEPGNCRWADASTQRLNRRSNYVGRLPLAE